MRARKAGIVDLGVSNITSVVNAFSAAGCDCEIITQDEPKKPVDVVVLPGVGHHGYLAPRLQNSPIKHTVVSHYEQGNPVIGICLGMQILFEGSAESEHQGLGLMAGEVRDLKRLGLEQDVRKVPNIGYGYTKINAVSGSKAVGKITDHSNYYYFLHSYALLASEIHRNCDIFGETDFAGVSICGMFIKDNLSGLQFHPERSGKAGLELLSELIKYLCGFGGGPAVCYAGAKK